MNRVELVWPLGRYTMGWLGAFSARLRYYGTERIPRQGGVVLAMNHFSWIDIPCFGVACPRSTYFVAKSEAHEIPGLGQFIRIFGATAVRRGESDREAVRRMREIVRDGNVLGIFVEGTRQRSGVPGRVQPGAAMVAIQEEVPVVPAAIYGTQFWNLGHFAPCSVAFGHPIDFKGLPKNGRGYKQATAEIEHSINRLFDWLAEVHAQGRPKGLTPP
jgi:1-acyl-sn-glycerol-3-phosphate acyltransferase